MNKNFIKLCLIITYLISFLPLRFFFRIKSNSDNLKIEPDKKYILIANHPTRIDAFLVLVSMSFRDYFRLMPMRFLVAEEYLDKWYKKAILFPLGDVSTKQDSGLKILDVLKSFLEDNQSIFIHPAGFLEKKDVYLKPKIGAVYLEREVKSAEILPVKIEIIGKLNLSSIIRRRTKATITFKKPFRHTKFNKDLQPLAGDLMDKINGTEI